MMMESTALARQGSASYSARFLPVLSLSSAPAIIHWSRLELRRVLGWDGGALGRGGSGLGRRRGGQKSGERSCLLVMATWLLIRTALHARRRPHARSTALSIYARASPPSSPPRADSHPAAAESHSRRCHLSARLHLPAGPAPGRVVLPSRLASGRLLCTSRGRGAGGGAGAAGQSRPRRGRRTQIHGRPFPLMAKPTSLAAPTLPGPGWTTTPSKATLPRRTSRREGQRAVA